MLDALHTDLLRAALRDLTPAGAMRALDLGCGAGAKTGWMHEFRRQAAGSRRQEQRDQALMGIDTDRRALALARAEQPHGRWICGDAHALPLTTASIDLIWCVAALGLMHTPTTALREAWRVLRPGGTLVVAQATQRWVQLRTPPALAPTAAPLPQAPADDLGHESAEQLQAAGFNTVQVRAYLLEPAGLSAAAAQAPLLEQAACDPFTEPEPLPVLILTAGRKAEGTAQRG